jgi:choline dehydrogenase-like flavoprotein
VKKLVAGLQYVLFHTGPLTSNGICAGGFARSDPRLERPDIQLNFSVWSFAERTNRGVVPHPFPGFTISAVHLRPDARGSVRLKSPDPLAAPAIGATVRLAADHAVKNAALTTTASRPRARRLGPVLGLIVVSALQEMCGLACPVADRNQQQERPDDHAQRSVSRDQGDPRVIAEASSLQAHKRHPSSRFGA